MGSSSAATSFSDSSSYMAFLTTEGCQQKAHLLAEDAVTAGSSSATVQTPPTATPSVSSPVPRNKASVVVQLPTKKRADPPDVQLCVNCEHTFSARDNVKGGCPDAPDRNVKWLRRLSCYSCAEAVAFWTLKEDGEMCDECGTENEKDRHYRQYHDRRRRLVFAATSVLVPCLCLYPLLVWLNDRLPASAKRPSNGGRHKARFNAGH